MQCSKPTVVVAVARLLRSMTFGPVSRPSPRITSTLRWRASPARPPVSLSTTPSFQPRIASMSISGRAEGDAGSAQLLGLGEHARDVQQGLGGDAAHVQAYAAERLAAIDQRHTQPEIGGAEGCRVAARPGAEHRDLHADVRVGR